MRNRSIVVLCLLVFSYGYSVAGEANAPGSEAHYLPSNNPDYKTAANARFNFWFDIPKTWQAFDRSKNGDGYFIVPDRGNPGIDIRIYGSEKTLSDRDYYAMLTLDGGTIENFRFGDGRKGKQIIVNGERYFIRNQAENRIVLYIQASQDWFKSNIDSIQTIARSIRPEHRR